MESIRKSKFYCFNNFHYDNELANNIRPSGAQVIIMYIIPPMCIYIEIYMSRSLYFLSREWHIVFVIFYYIYFCIFFTKFVSTLFKYLVFVPEQEKLVKDFFLFLEKNYGWGNKLQNLIASVFVICSCIFTPVGQLVVYIPGKRNNRSILTRPWTFSYLFLASNQVKNDAVSSEICIDCVVLPQKPDEFC